MSEDSIDDSLIDQDTVRFFLWSVWNFFNNSTGTDPEVGTPYLFTDFDHDEYTGVIGVSGTQSGAVYFTMGQKFIDKIFTVNFPEIGVDYRSEEHLEEMRKDYAGEMTNIISGNARNYLGERFLISVPVVITEPNTALHLAKGLQGIVFPIKWAGEKVHLILNLQKNEKEEEVKLDVLEPSL